MIFKNKNIETAAPKKVGINIFKLSIISFHFNLINAVGKVDIE